MNDAYLKLYGLSDRSEAIGQPVYDHVAPEERGEVAERIESLQLGELPLGELYEYTVYGRDGQERIVQIRGMPVKYHGQAASISIHRDITGRVRAEQELKRILSLYKATLGSTADGILVVDLAGKVVNYNLRFMQMWQMTSEILDSDYKHPGQQR